MWTILLNEVGSEALPIVGGKGAQLGVVLRGGLPVPAGEEGSLRAIKTRFGWK